MREIVALVVLFVPLSLMSFGGGASILAPMHATVVDTHHWLTAREFVDFFAISRASPGPGAMIATLVGWHVAGWGGAIAATLAMFVPSSLLCYRLAKIWNGMRGTALHTALLRGLLPIGTGLSIAGGALVLQTADAGVRGWIVAAVATVLATWSNVHPMIVLASGGALFLCISMLVG